MVGMDSRGRSHNGGKARSVVGRLGLSLFFLIFLTLGSLFEVVILRELGRALGQRAWNKVSCTIVSSEVQEYSDDRTLYTFAVSYQYAYADRWYTGSAYQRNYWGSDKYSEAQTLVQKYPAGASLYCYVNPANPGEAVLQRDSLALGLVLLLPTIFLLIGAGGIYFTWRKRQPETAQPIAATALRQGQTKGMGKYGTAAFFGLFAVVGGAMLYPLGIKPIAKTIAARSWVATPCQVLRARVRSHDSDDGTTYSVDILYQYEFHGQIYKSDRYDFLGGSSSGHGGKARIVAQYQGATNHVCYVNPRDPSEAVLRRGFHAKLLLALFPLPFLLIGVGGLIGIWRGKAPAGSRPMPPWRGRGDPKRELSCLGTLPALAARGHPGLALPGPIGSKIQGQDALATKEQGRDALATLRVADGGRVVLTPKASAKTKFIGMMLAAIFWNGIVSVFVFNMIGDFRRGDPSWFGLLFLLPFAAVGVGLIAGAVYQFLALFNPRPTLALSSHILPLGSAAELNWSFVGQTGRIQELTVTLRGVEEARYRRGTSTYTDKNTFYEMELYRTSDPHEIAAGQVGLVLPPDTMHSFEAENNKILWNLDIHGRIRRWPDVQESFPITVTPRAG